MLGPLDWLDGIEADVTVTADDGTIVAMNTRACATFADDGGAALVGKSVFDCHPEPARAKTMTLFREHRPNHYLVRKNGRTRVVHQIPWLRNGEFAGIVEISVPVPGIPPLIDRDEP
jgi:transcriptional regulator with PAS, ATPase and Fis domain